MEPKECRDEAQLKALKSVVQARLAKAELEGLGSPVEP